VLRAPRAVKARCFYFGRGGRFEGSGDGYQGGSPLVEVRAG
jgi:hypothetical protein